MLVFHMLDTQSFKKEAFNTKVTLNRSLGNCVVLGLHVVSHRVPALEAFAANLAVKCSLRIHVVIKSRFGSEFQRAMITLVVCLILVLG